MFSNAKYTPNKLVIGIKSVHNLNLFREGSLCEYSTSSHVSEYIWGLTTELGPDSAGRHQM